MSQFPNFISTVLENCPPKVMGHENKQGESTCNRDTDCYSGSCSTTLNECVPVGADGKIGSPMLQCIVDSAEKSVRKHMALTLGVHVDLLKSAQERGEIGLPAIDYASSQEWKDASDGFEDLIKRDGCAGPDQEFGWCVLGHVQESDCILLEELGGSQHKLKWVENPSSGAGWCRLNSESMG